MLGQRRDAREQRALARIAVVGSGIGGLAAVQNLSGRGHRVIVFEAQPSLGMDAHAVSVPGSRGEVRVDVPMRVFFPEYYPKLVRLYEEAGVGSETLNYSGSFGSLEGDLYFKYRTYPLAGTIWPFLDRRAINPDVIRLGAELVSFLSRLRLLPPSPARLDGVTFGDFLDDFGCSDRLRGRFLMPLFAAICTCSYASLAMYPARTIVGYLASVITSVKMRRVSLGVRHVVETLSAGAEEVRLASPVRSLLRTADGVEVEDHEGHRDRFDHVVLATQANQALRILGERATPEERAALSAFGYETFDVVTHTDRRLAPPNERWWSPVNFLLEPESTAPMATILMNPIHRGLGDAPPLLQTWNPLLEPAPDRVYSRVSLERPLVHQTALAGHEKLKELHRQAGRQVWFCGSYASAGVPLQESAVTSALEVSRLISTATGPGTVVQGVGHGFES